jgi:hypothetical protein
VPELRLVLTAFALIAAMVLAGFIGARQRSGIVLLALLCFVWFTVDREFEGGVLVTISSTHGLVSSDFVGIAGLAVAAWLWVRSVRR